MVVNFEIAAFVVVADFRNFFRSCLLRGGVTTVVVVAMGQVEWAVEIGVRSFKFGFELLVVHAAWPCVVGVVTEGHNEITAPLLANHFHGCSHLELARFAGALVADDEETRSRQTVGVHNRRGLFDDFVDNWRWFNRHRRQYLCRRPACSRRGPRASIVIERNRRSLRSDGASDKITAVRTCALPMLRTGVAGPCSPRSEASGPLPHKGVSICAVPELRSEPARHNDILTPEEPVQNPAQACHQEDHVGDNKPHEFD